jgi:DNA-binding transcriptional LysR family regulator
LYYKISDLIEEFSQQYPQIRVIFSENDSYNAIKALAAQQVDIAIVPEYVLSHDEEYTIYPLFSDDVVLFANRANIFREQDSVSLDELADAEFILLSANTSIYRMSMDICQKAGFSPKIGASGLRLPTVASYINKNLGVSLMMQRVASSVLCENTMILPLNPPISFKFSAVVKGKISRESKLFLEYAQAYFSKMVQLATFEVFLKKPASVTTNNMTAMIRATELTSVEVIGNTIMPPATR